MIVKQIAVVLIGIIISVADIHSFPLPDFNLLWNYNEPAQTETKFRALLPEAEKNNNASYLAELRTQIARALGLQGKFIAAHALLDTVQQNLENVNDQARARYFLERGRVFNSSQHPEKAIPLFQEAFDRAVMAWLDLYAVDAAYMIATTETMVDSRRSWNNKGVTIAEKSNDPRARRWVGSFYNAIATDFFSAKKYDSALVFFEKTVKIRRQTTGQLTLLRVARWSVGKTYRMLGQLDSALEIQYELEKEYKRAGREDTGYILEEIAECLLAQGHTKEATPYFAKAYEKLKQDTWLSHDEPARLERLKSLGGVK